MTLKNYSRLPYMVDFKVADKLVIAVAQRGSLEVGELYAQIPSIDDSSKSAAKNFAEYLGLIRTEGRVVYLTELYARILRADENSRRSIYVQNIPPEYLAMLKFAGQTPEGNSIENLASSFLSSKGLNPNAALGKYILRTWANYMERLGLVRYAKGRNSSVQLTALGVSVLQNSAQSQPVENLPRFLVHIITPERNLPYDIQSDEDWAVIDAAIHAAKQTWKKYHTQ